MNQATTSFADHAAKGDHFFKITPKQEARFWKKLNKDGPLPDQNNPHYAGLGKCWEWTRGKRDGYGRLSIVTKDGKKLYNAHRIAFALHNGWMPSVDSECMHKCDNRACCNPAHLAVGTKLDNSHDSVKKGRRPIGESNHGKLTEEQVREIRMSKESYRKLAKKYGVGPSTIWACTHGLSWTHV